MIWLEPWIPIAQLEWDEVKKVDYRRGWETQLEREVGPLHVLFRRQATLIARRFDTDDTLFQLEGNQVAEVHLTWRGGAEPDPLWPNTTIYNSLDDWARTSMTVEHQDWMAANGSQ